MEDASSSRAGKRKHQSKGWSRDEVVVCNCVDLMYKHVDCPCELCDGKAVSTSAEYRHWQHNKYLDLETDLELDDLFDTSR